MLVRSWRSMPRLSPRAQNRQQQDGEGVEEQEAVATLRIVDPQHTHAHAEAQILAVAEAGLDGPSFGIELDDLGRRSEASLAARCQASFMPTAFTQITAPTSGGGGDFASRNMRARPPLPTQSAATAFRPAALTDVAAEADDVQSPGFPGTRIA